MNQETFKDILNNEQVFSILPDAANQHWAQPDYIRGLITRARVLHCGMSREDAVKKCGVSLSSLNKYIAVGSRHIPCPYSVQFLLERLAKLKSSERASVFKLEMTVPKADVGFFSQFDNFMASDMMTGLMGTSVEISAVLSSDEVYKLRKEDVNVSAAFGGNY